MYRTKSDKCIVRYCIYSLGVAQAFAACRFKLVVDVLDWERFPSHL